MLELLLKRFTANSGARTKTIGDKNDTNASGPKSAIMYERVELLKMELSTCAGLLNIPAITELELCPYVPYREIAKCSLALKWGIMNHIEAINQKALITKNANPNFLRVLDDS